MKKIEMWCKTFYKKQNSIYNQRKLTNYFYSKDNIS